MGTEIHRYKKLTNAQKRYLAYHEGARSAILEISYDIDNLICESCKYRENDKLWRLRDKVQTLQQIANDHIREIKE